MSELIGITPQEAAHRACNLGISGRSESLVELLRWAQNAILSASGAPVEMRVLPGEPFISDELRACWMLSDEQAKQSLDRLASLRERA